MPSPDLDQLSPRETPCDSADTSFVAASHCKTSQALVPFAVCLHSPGERHLATSSHALNRAKIEQRVPKLPVRLKMSESNKLGAGTLLGGRVATTVRETYVESTGGSEKAPFMSEKSEYRGCQSWENDRKWSKSAATSYNPGI